MQDLSPYLFIHIGLLIRLLRQAKGFTIKQIVGEADLLAKQLDAAEFTVSTQGLHKLKRFIDDLRKGEDQKRGITASEVTELKAIMEMVEQMVFAEAQTKKIYLLTESRFSLDSLMNKPWQMFAKKTFTRLPSLAVYDISEGFKCIVLARPTAAAFHLLRASEAALRSYYFQVVKRGRVTKPMWANMIQHLRTKRKPDEALLQRLDYIRDIYRNPTVHPDAQYTLEQAQDLLGLCIEVMNAMAKSLPDPKVPS